MATVLITGVNRGIGLELLKQYAACGWRVIGTCRNPGAAPEAMALAAEHGDVSLYPLDVTDVAATNALASQLEGVPIDVLILNAGVMSGKSLVLGALDADDFRHVLDVNVVSLAMGAQAFSPHVQASERKVMVGMGSFLGSIASNSDGGLYSYRASKAAVHAIMRTLAVDLESSGVIAIAMHPGWVQTDMGGKDATITTEESVTGMMGVIEGLGPGDSGGLFAYSGEQMPW